MAGLVSACGSRTRGIVTDQSTQSALLDAGCDWARAARSRVGDPCPLRTAPEPNTGVRRRGASSKSVAFRRPLSCVHRTATQLGGHQVAQQVVR